MPQKDTSFSRKRKSFAFRCIDRKRIDLHAQKRAYTTQKDTSKVQFPELGYDWKEHVAACLHVRIIREGSSVLSVEMTTALRCIKINKQRLRERSCQSSVQSAPDQERISGALFKLAS